jgi:hypothetical protein
MSDIVRADVAVVGAGLGGLSAAAPGVARFKLGLGGRLARGLGAWDFPGNRAAYLLYSVVLPRYLGWLRRRHAGQAAPGEGM